MTFYFEVSFNFDLISFPVQKKSTRFQGVFSFHLQGRVTLGNEVEPLLGIKKLSAVLF